ncbi:complement C1q tumor necrosis factor-related protein 3-like isoform X1 [Crassostrea angulata]|uniref:complement C1q tumor necrosis factor-related protein 3-like isoform X1 n=1 Tax=Magallana angulata TaxID=2784310 RepID=UPI0022B1D6BC|nr:complement C1q tumor necrosis factor-related protein 3-like isoform X1 [Crassostrea angulata]
MKTIALVCVVMCLTFGIASSHYYYGKGMMSVLSKQAEALYQGLAMVSSEDGGMLTSHHDHGYHGYRHRVTFTAVTSSSAKYSSGTTIPFTTVKTNYGNAFNNGNYRFTAPSNGVYVFSWSIATHSSYYGHAKLMKNGSTYHQVHCSSGYQQCGATVTIILNKHDQVWLASDSSSTYVLATYSSFSGWKLN